MLALSGTKAGLFSSWSCRYLCPGSERGIVLVFFFSLLCPEFPGAVVVQRNAGAELLLPFQHELGVKAPGGDQSPRKTFQRELHSVLFLLLLLAGAKPAASVDPWAAPAGSTAQPLAKNVDPWAPAQPSSTAAKPSVDPWGSAPANKPLSTSGEQRSRPISILFE